jgi:hypothetical protein
LTVTWLAAPLALAATAALAALAAAAPLAAVPCATHGPADTSNAAATTIARRCTRPLVAAGVAADGADTRVIIGSLSAPLRSFCLRCLLAMNDDKIGNTQ